MYDYLPPVLVVSSLRLSHTLIKSLSHLFPHHSTIHSALRKKMFSKYIQVINTFFFNLLLTAVFKSLCSNLPKWLKHTKLDRTLTKNILCEFVFWRITFNLKTILNRRFKSEYFLLETLFSEAHSRPACGSTVSKSGCFSGYLSPI